MLVNIDEEKIEFWKLPKGVVFNYNGITYMKVNVDEFKPEEGEEVTEEEDEGYFTSMALNLATLWVEHFDYDLKIPARCVFKPTEITFK